MNPDRSDTTPGGEDGDPTGEATAQAPWWDDPAAGDDATTVVVADAAGVSVPARWAARAVVLGLAGVLVAGTGWLALRSGTATAGAPDPERAVTGFLEAVDAGDLLGVVELVEPAERDSLGSALVDVVGELQRLEILDPDLDLGAVDGVGLSFGEVGTRAEPVTDDIVTVVVSGGGLTARLVADRPPLGPLVVDRLPPDVRGEEFVSESGPGVEFGLTTVRRDGRWYVSGLYTLAELARREAGAPPPDPARRLVARGAPDPGTAVRGLVDDLVAADPRGVLARLAPDEAAVLYDYAGVYLGDLEEAVADAVAAARAEGWTWSVEELETAATVDGDSALVTVTRFRYVAAGPDTAVDVRLDETGVDLELRYVDGWTGERLVTRVRIDGEGCRSGGTSVVEPGDGSFGPSPPLPFALGLLDVPPAEFDLDGDGRVCPDEIPTPVPALSGLLSPVGAAATPGVVVRRVDGAWYVSPVRSVTAPILDLLGSLDARGLASTVDAFIDPEGPFGAGPAPPVPGPFGDAPTPTVPSTPPDA